LCNHNLYILEPPSSWSTSRIPQSRVRLRLLLLSTISILLICFGLPGILQFTPLAHVSRSNPPNPVAHVSSLNPPLPTGRLNTNVQVNNIAMLHLIYTDTHIYITFILLFIPFFKLLPLFGAGRLAQTLLVCHTYYLRIPEKFCISIQCRIT
jgi:hypothetical protein